jgi:hypothetical protein
MANSIIINNSGDDQYNFIQRDLASNPLKCSFLKVILADDSQLSQTLEIRRIDSTGVDDIRKLPFSRYVSSQNRNNLILTFPLTPPLILDGNTSFKLAIPALSQVQLMFYYDRQPG